MTIQKTLAACITSALLLVSGCDEVRVESSKKMYENAVVESKQHIDGKNNLANGAAYGVAMKNLSLGVAYGTATSHPEHNYVVFKGHKKKFTVDDKTLYDKVKTGEAAVVSYREVCRNTYEDKDGDGKKEYQYGSFLEYEFIEAKLKTNLETRVK